MNERGYRGRAFHRVRQPGVQQELRRLAHRAHEQQQADQGQRIDVEVQIVEAFADEVRCLGENRVEIDRAGEQEHREDAERKTEVADPVDDECLHRSRICLRLVEPEANQQVAREPHPLPAEKQLGEIIRCHQHQHREGEERQVGEEPRPVRIVGHVADRIEVDETRHRGHHHQHDGGERVDMERPVDPEIARRDEVENGHPGIVTVQSHIDERDTGKHPGDREQRRGNQLR